MLNKTQKQAVRELFKNSYYDEEQAFKLAEQVRKAVSEKNGRIYCNVDHVSKSGMSRHISVCIGIKNDIINLNYTPFAKVFGDRSRVEKSGGVYISGCGMDMLFEATYRLYCFFYPYKKNGQSRPYQKHLNRYRSL